MHKNLIFIVTVIALHAWAIWIFSYGFLTLNSPVLDEALVTVFIRPRVLQKTHNIRADAHVDRLSVLLGHPLSVLDIKTPRIDFTVDRNVNAAMAAPVLDSDAPVDSSIFVQRAALSPGEGATVVFRIEVLEDGSAGQITIDVSSGSAQIDEAALEFARAHRWIPAVVAGIPKAMWIRWSVRLQA